MREINFRAKDRTGVMNGDWFYGSLDLITNSEYPKILCKDRFDNVMVIDVDENTICEYTGVKDKNDKEVYEGDIIFLEEEHLYGKVCWENLRWYIYWYGWIDKEGLGTVYDIVNENPLSDELLTSEDKIWLPIIGNIYDNPELLKGENLYG